MIYRSNLAAPDLSPHFKLLSPPRLMMGHDAPSDPDFEPECTYLTHDEAAILYNVAKAFPLRWVDIGARFGWSTAHIAAAMPMGVTPVDPHLTLAVRLARFEGNIGHFWDEITEIAAVNSERYFADVGHTTVQAAMIDGDHDEPQPMLDAERAMKAGAFVIVFHDFWGRPIRDAVRFLLTHPGWHVRVYNTPNGMAVCWEDVSHFVPPDHIPDPGIEWNPKALAPEFDWSVCE